jgi:hypothetical protein
MQELRKEAAIRNIEYLRNVINEIEKKLKGN